MSLARSIRLSVMTTTLGLASAISFADVGELDKYDCHKHQETRKYHCHGSTDLAKMGGLILGADLRTQAWSTSGDDLYLFGGASVNAEFNHNWIAVSAGYHYMPLISGVTGNDVQFNDAVILQGFEAGVKAGPGVGRLGGKFFLTAGWSQSEISDSGDSSHDGELAGYYAGAGFGANSRKMHFEVTVTYRDPEIVKSYLQKVENFSGDVLSLDTRINMGWRF